MKKAIIYARYSCERQTEQSIEGQLRVCNQFAKDNDILVLENYIDRATSGTNDNRAAFQRMLKDSAERQWDYVIVYKGDRFARNRIESAINKKILRDNGVKVLSATENIPDTPEGIILESLLEGMAEYYSAELSQKVKRGINESRAKKQYTGGFVMYGYDIVGKKYQVNTREAPIVREIFEKYAGGMIVKDIVADLNARGLKNKQGNPFTLNTVYRMLRFERYTGIMRVDDQIYTDIVPAIITQEMWDTVSNIIAANKRAPSRRKSYAKYLLSGKLFCGECGGLMTGEAGTSKTGAVYHYYKCFEKKKHTRPCTMPSIKKDEIENKVFSVCCDVLNSGFVPLIVDRAYQLHREDMENNITIINLKGELAEKEKALKNILKAIENGLFSNITQERMAELEKETAQIKVKIESELSKSDALLSKEDFQTFLDSFIAKQADNEEFKADVINLLIRQVVLFKDKIRITFNYTPKGGKKRSHDYDMALAELAEAQAEHNGERECSNSFLLPPPKQNNPNTTVFVTNTYWGVWIAEKIR